jgi:hypothetical protein
MIPTFAGLKILSCNEYPHAATLPIVPGVFVASSY